MKTVILTPLFPPDTSNSAQYVKLLAAKLTQQTVTIIAYGKLPESIPGVKILAINKRSGKLTLTYQTIRALLKTNPQKLLVQNGPSSELPALIFSYLRRVDLIYVISDIGAAKRKNSWIKNIVTNQICLRAVTVIELPDESTGYLPPEHLPFQYADQAIMDAQNKWWTSHIQQITES